MSVNVKVYDNGDHTCLVWLPADKQPIKDCRGFTIRKVLNGAESFLHGFAKFTEQDPDVPDPAWTRPLQRYMWWDYGVRPGDKVRYSVIPVVGKDRNSLQLATADASTLTDEMTVTGQMTGHVSAYFNKGIVAPVGIARYHQVVSRRGSQLSLSVRWQHALSHATLSSRTASPVRETPPTRRCGRLSVGHGRRGPSGSQIDDRIGRNPSRPRFVSTRTSHHRFGVRAARSSTAGNDVPRQAGSTSTQPH